ncbi:N-acetyltransferase family protein [Methylobacterium sp. JK268]
MTDPILRALTGAETLARAEALAEILIDCVETGASVSFMAPLPRDKALAYWRGVGESAGRGERVVIVAEAEGEILGTAQLVLAQPENQPHRADVSKVLVPNRARRRGIGAALMRALDAQARQAGKTLLVLDTASPEAERLYVREGWQRVGAIPGYALLPDGRPCDTILYYKALA